MKKIALINDLSGFGRCSLTAAIPVISVMGVQACPIPTAFLSAQTGFSNYSYFDFTDHMNDFTDSWQNMNVCFDGIYSGFLGNEAQVKNVFYFLEHFYKDNAIFLADPIMGDNGSRFSIFTSKLLSVMKELTKNATVITPNLTELCLLTDTDYAFLTSHSHESDYEQRIHEIACKLIDNANKPQSVIVTGIISLQSQQPYMGNLAVNTNNSCYIKTPYTGKSFSGTGDLFASVIIGSLVNGMSLEAAINKAVNFLQPAIEEASLQINADRNHGIPFEKYLRLLH